MQNKISIDMFDVGLGSSILTQLYLSGDEPIRVLADAGITEKEHYKKDTVHKKLVKRFGNSFRLDLIVGTHYDEDHLAGLVPIINDAQIEIGEVWLPPVNVISKEQKGHGESETDTLPQLLLTEEVDIKSLSNELLNIAIELSATLVELAKNEDILLEANYKYDESSTPLESFKCLKLIAQNVLDQVGDSKEFEWDDEYLFSYPRLLDDLMFEKSIYRYFRKDIVALAYIQKAVCKSAITAQHLADVIMAIQKRNSRSTQPKITLRTYLIQTGVPRFFSWDGQGKVFKESKQRSDMPCITLLGPSVELRNKYFDKLPQAFYLNLYNIRYTTPSNRLSYVFNIEYLNQKVLICGDAGFYDFRPRRTTNFYPKLLDELKNINVLQVAHHAGNNEYFYKGLEAAGFVHESDVKYLLIQHEYHDCKRPNSSFHDFVISRNRYFQGKTKILFTCEPLLARVQCYRQLIAPLVGIKKARRDNACLEFSNQWHITKHLIQI